LVKAIVLVALGIAAFKLVRADDGENPAWRVVGELGLNPANRVVSRLLAAISGLTPRRLEQLGVGSFVYAAVFLVEGVGLLLRKRWAEYVTTIVTGSLIPFEVYELAHKPSAAKVAGLVLNVLVVVYLVLRLRGERREAANAPHGD
jgi:uncharacterized membrane protein (DUF2068 family)